LIGVHHCDIEELGFRWVCANCCIVGGEGVHQRVDVVEVECVGRGEEEKEEGEEEENRQTNARHGMYYRHKINECYVNSMQRCAQVFKYSSIQVFKYSSIPVIN
jgi:hypothetical protein